MPNFTNGHVLTTVTNYLIPHFEKLSADLTKRQRILLAKLEADGRISTGRASAEFKLPSNYKEATPFNFQANSVVTYAPVDRLKWFTFNHASYGVTDQITHLEKMLAQGPDAIINRYSEILPNLSKDLAKQLCKDLYIDGNATGNELSLQGFESWAGSGTTAAGDINAKPSDTYGGLSTAVGSYGGTWSANLTTSPNANIATDWPYGYATGGGPLYDFNSPKLLNWSSNAWPGAATTFIANAGYVLRAAMTQMSRLGDREDKPSLVIMASKLFVDFKNLMDDTMRNIMPHEEARDLGFPMDVLNYEGLMVTHEYDCPDNVGYVLNTNKMELASVAPQLIWMQPPAYESSNLSDNFIVGFYGQLMTWAKNQGKFKNYA